MPKKPYIEFYSLVRVVLSEKPSCFEIFDLARFWPYDPSSRGHDLLGGHS